MRDEIPPLWTTAFVKAVMHHGIPPWGNATARGTPGFARQVSVVVICFGMLLSVSQ